ncbi:hypothetical protein C518_2068 [Lysinibacillus fusiformis ZB2]|nr:hypothetical protein C518_2068 [Lysinibacillus fusiformis ZB2]
MDGMPFSFLLGNSILLLPHYHREKPVRIVLTNQLGFPSKLFWTLLVSYFQIYSIEIKVEKQVLDFLFSHRLSRLVFL